MKAFLPNLSIRLRRINFRLLQIINFHDRDAGRAVLAAHDGGVVAGWERRDNDELARDLLRDDGCRLQGLRRQLPGITFVVHVAAVEERHLVQHALLERFQSEVNHRRDVESN